jgi:beta-lactamase regulating signal transducer with metallopeptidase domain
MTLLLWLLTAAVKTTVLVAVVAVSLRLLRVTAPDTQLRVWSFVVMAALVLPFVPAQWVVPVDIETLAPIGDVRFPIQISRSEIADSQSPLAASRFPIIDGPWLAALYVSVAAFLLARLFTGWRWVRRLRTSARTVPGRTFLESPLVRVPVTVGLLSPRVIVPDDWRSWPADTLDAVVLHEGAHAARRDGLWVTLALLHRALHWVNPVSWWLPRHIAALAERASDDAALERGMAPSRYAEVLLMFATAVATHHRRVAWILPMARLNGRDTERRLDRVLSWKGRASMTRPRAFLLALVVVVAAVVVYTATIASLSVQVVPVPQEIIAFPAVPPPPVEQIPAAPSGR